jgi:periplasmic protein TonB
MPDQDGRCPAHAGRRTGSAFLASVTLHAAAGAAIVAAIAWRAAPTQPGPEPALQVVWLDATATAPEATERREPEADTTAPASPAPLGPFLQEGLEPEDALATMLGDMVPPPEPAPVDTALLPLAIPSDPNEQEQAPTQHAALTMRQSLPEATEDLPLPPPAPPPPPRRALASPRAPTPQTAPAPIPATLAVPAPAAPADAAVVPVLSGAPRFRSPAAPPEYPTSAREMGIEGTALLRLRIAADGTTQEMRLLRSAGHRLLDDAALAAARRWEIEPALQAGRRIEAWVEVPVRFRLAE